MRTFCKVDHNQLALMVTVVLTKQYSASPSDLKITFGAKHLCHLIKVGQISAKLPAKIDLLCYKGISKQFGGKFVALAGNQIIWQVKTVSLTLLLSSWW